LIVIDTSVAVKWTVPEKGTDAALSLIDQQLTAPDLFVIEVGHVLTKKVRMREIPKEVAAAAFIEIPSQITLVDCRAFHVRAFELAIRLHHSIFDCYFLALAEAANTELVSADEVFVRKTREMDPNSPVRLLGEVSRSS
jgi:predicted nucleic acid-binding protein